MSLPKVLFVDDEANILQSVRRVMRKANVEVETTTSPEQAIEMAKETKFAVVVSDQRMPGMGGVEVLENIRGVSPDSVRVILTGYADVKAATDAINKGAVWRYLNKPWDDDDLRNCVRQGIDQFLLIQENRRLQELTQQQNEQLRDLNENLKQKVMERTWEVHRLNEQLESSFMGAVQAMARLGEMHSQDVGSHAKRVALLSRRMAKRLQYEGRDLMQVEVAATLHDIGKTMISPAILKKANEDLSSAEQHIFKEHPMHGESIIRMVPNNEEAALYVRHHHERFDGRGYPDGFAGEAIPLGARIIAVADAYDKHMTISTSATSSPAVAMRKVEDGSGAAFDPSVVSTLRAVIREIEGRINPREEAQIGFEELAPGMVLSRDLKSPDGRLLAQADHPVDPVQLAALRHINAKQPISQAVYVYSEGQGDGMAEAAAEPVERA